MAIELSDKYKKSRKAKQRRVGAKLATSARRVLNKRGGSRATSTRKSAGTKSRKLGQKRSPTN